MKNLKIAVIGIGRIGMIHVRNIQFKTVGAELFAIADPLLKDEDRLAFEKSGVAIVTRNTAKVISNPAVDAFVICTPTATHIDLIKQIIELNKRPVFCEKPLTLEWKQALQLMALVQKEEAFVQMGYNRRFDINFRMVQEAIQQNKIGTPYLIAIASYDPYPPPLSYVKQAGMMWTDMNIHDFDMVRFVSGQEVVEVCALGANLIESAFVGTDVDVTIISLKLQNGTLGTIRASRKSPAGYDQRIEVLGSTGRVKTDNVRSNTLKLDSSTSRLISNPLNFFTERYAQAYEDELQVFVNAVTRKQKPVVSLVDDLAAIKIAIACEMSYRQKRPVRIAEVTKMMEDVSRD